jgi:hypothetical protein
MPDHPIPLKDFKNMDESTKALILWQAYIDSWTKINETISHQKEIEADTIVHHRLLITGNGAPSVMERMRNIEKYIEDQKYWTRFLVGALILQTLTFLGATIVALIQFLPVLQRIAQNPL